MCVDITVGLAVIAVGDSAVGVGVKVTDVGADVGGTVGVPVDVVVKISVGDDSVAPLVSLLPAVAVM